MIKNKPARALRNFLVQSHISLWWLIHRDRKRVPEEHLGHYRKVFSRALKRTGKVPAIFDGEDYNNKIRWLMIFDQNPLIVQCTDKLAVRDYVKEIVGEKYLNKIYAIWPSAKEIDFSALPESFVLKTNHDSGSVWLVKNRNEIDLGEIQASVQRSLDAEDYGWEKGEWAYRHITPKAFAEEYLMGDAGGAPDFKFHCSSGKVCFIQYIYDRATSFTKEVLVEPDGKVMPVVFDEDFQVGSGFDIPAQWDELVMVAETLAKPFKYVRVDLYIHNGSIRFGELTFSPRTGAFTGKDQAFLGGLLEIDRSSVLPPFSAC